MQKLFSCLLYIFTHYFNPEIIYIYIFLRPAKFEDVLIGFHSRLLKMLLSVWYLCVFLNYKMLLSKVTFYDTT